MQNYKSKFIQKHYEYKQRSKSKQALKHYTAHQKLKIYVDEESTSETKRRFLRTQKLYNFKKLWTSTSEAKGIYVSQRTDIIRTIDSRECLLQGSALSTERNIRLFLSIWGAFLRIVLLYYYYSKWMSDNVNSKVVE